MRFGFYTDAHLTGKKFISRLDDYPMTIVGKIEELYRHAKAKKLDFMLLGGDLFHTHKIYSYEVLTRLVKAVRGLGKPTYFITGQHDLYGGNMDFYAATTLSFVSEMCDGMMIPVFKKVELKDCVIHGCHNFMAPVDFIQAVPKSEKFQICLDHHYLHDKDEQFEVIRTTSIGSTNVDLVLSGDLHSGYPFHTIGNTSYYNPGSLARNSIIHIERKVRMGVFEVSNIMGSWDIQMAEYFPKQADGKDVFKENTLEKVFELKKTADSFVQCFEAVKSQAVDVFHLLDIVAKESPISKELMGYIMSFKKEAAK